MLALGLMSGTSMDGIDLALLETDGGDRLAFGPTGFAWKRLGEPSRRAGRILVLQGHTALDAVQPYRDIPPGSDRITRGTEHERAIFAVLESPSYLFDRILRHDRDAQRRDRPVNRRRISERFLGDDPFQLANLSLNADRRQSHAGSSQQQSRS